MLSAPGALCGLPWDITFHNSSTVMRSVSVEIISGGIGRMPRCNTFSIQSSCTSINWNALRKCVVKAFSIAGDVSCVTPLSSSIVLVIRFSCLFRFFIRRCNEGVSPSVLSCSAVFNITRCQYVLFSRTMFAFRLFSLSTLSVCCPGSRTTS